MSVRERLWEQGRTVRIRDEGYVASYRICLLNKLLRARQTGAAIRESLGRTCAAEHTAPINAVRLPGICRYFHQTRLDHDLLGRLINRDEQLADVVDVAACLAKENHVR